MAEPGRFNAGRRPSVRLRWVGLAALLAWTLSAPAWARPVLPADAQATILALLRPIGFEQRQPDGTIVDGAAIGEREVRFFVHAAGQTDRDPPAATLTLRPRGDGIGPAGAMRSRSFLIRLDVRPEAPPAVRKLAQAAADAIVRNDAGDLYREVDDGPAEARAPPRTTTAAWTPAPDQTVVAAAALAVWLGLLLAWWAFRRAGLLRGRGWSTRFRLTHLLPATLQLVIFAYWGLYWHPLGEVWAPIIALEVLYAVGLDLWLGLHRNRELQFGVGALPIALSTNLFVIYPPGRVGLTLVAIAIALWSKHHLRLPRGHLFNPSALGLVVVGLGAQTIGRMNLGDTAAEFSLMPNGTLLVLLLGLVVQWRLGVVLVSIGAFFGLQLLVPVLGKQIYDPAWAPVTLVITLLVTDPATSPRGPLERLIFGFLAGVAMQLVGHACIAVWDNDFYGKVGGVVVANALVPVAVAAREALARRGGRFEGAVAGLERALQPRYRLGHIALFWLLVLGVDIARDAKAMRFVAYETAWQSHLENGTPLLDPGPERRPDCGRNPIFCQPLSVPAELRGWLARGRSATLPPTSPPGGSP